MRVFLCRWPNGDFSVIAARNREDAVVALDEWGNAEEAQLWPMENCMIDFRLNDAGAIELTDAGFGEDTMDEVMNRCYPELKEALESVHVRGDDSDEYSEAAAGVIREGVDRERTRLVRSEGPNAETQIGEELRKMTGAPSELVNRWVKRAANKVLERSEDDLGEPN